MLILGVDGSFSVLSFIDSTDNLRVVPPIPQQQVVRLAATARVILSWSDSTVKVWRIEEIDEFEFDGDDCISKRYLLEMELNVIFPLYEAYCRARRVFQLLQSPLMPNIFWLQHYRIPNYSP